MSENQETKIGGVNRGFTTTSSFQSQGAAQPLGSDENDGAEIRGLPQVR
jgi:hypothetical protein